MAKYEVLKTDSIGAGTKFVGKSVNNVRTYPKTSKKRKK